MRLGLRIVVIFLLAVGPQVSLGTVQGRQGRAFLFDAAGLFLDRIDHIPGADLVVVLDELAHNPLVARFADPEHDPALLGPATRLCLAGPDEVRGSLAKSGVQDPVRHGGIKALWYLARESSYGGVLDFSRNEVYGLRDDIFYLTQSKSGELLVHNRFNYGNYLWGASAHELGVPIPLVIIGTHVQNFFGSRLSRWHLDSRDDVRSIRAGFYWGRELQ